MDFRTREDDSFGFKRSYLCSFLGIVTLILVASYFFGSVSVGAVPKKLVENITRSDPEHAYLAFSVSGFFIEGALFLLNAFNIVNIGIFKKLPWTAGTAVINGVYTLAMLALGVTCAKLESDIATLASTSPFKDHLDEYYNYGSIGAAAFFAFVCSILHVLHLIYTGIKWRSGK